MNMFSSSFCFALYYNIADKIPSVLGDHHMDRKTPLSNCGVGIVLILSKQTKNSH